MGLMWSTVLSYAGILEALEFFKNITNGMIPEGDPDFRDLVEYYRSQLELRANSSAPSNDWIDESNHGYLYLIEDDRGKLQSASLKYYGNHPDSTAILFSTKISSFGQDSVESIISNNGKANGDYYTNRSERYPITTKTIVTNTSESFSVGQRSRSPTVSRDGVSDSNRCYDNRSKDNDDRDEQAENEEKLTWRYRPLSPSPTLPEIRFQSYDGDDKGVCDDEFLRSLDGIKFRPLQRNDPSGRRKTFRKRNSSSSTSSRDSRASREEELKMFTSLEEAEFKRIGRDENVPNYRSTPNLVVHSSSSGQQNCDEKTNETFVGNVDNEDSKTKLKDLPKLDSFEEETPAEPSVKENELIFSGEYTKAMNKDWHSGHFCCWQCDESLTGQRYVLRDEHPYCIKCYESVFANGCEECNKIIGIDSKDLSYKDKHWHEACFLCAKCRVSLVDKQFGSKLDKIYCGNCYDAQFASRCDGCGEVFRAGTKKMEYKTRQWHEKCFCCVVCKNPIGTKSFIPREQEIYCAGCYEDKFATRCVKCNKIITQGGVTYKNEPWHRECFTCTNCNTSLAGQRFTSRDEKPYCAECFGELFAKRCTSCSKPITGIGGTRFISFEDRHWHNDCFICAQCKTSLVGKGFITDGQDIICPECAKQNLM